jgi:class 3 adenylate cyclase
MSSCQIRVRSGGPSSATPNQVSGTKSGNRRLPTTPRAVRCGRAIIEAVQPLGLDVRAGAHTGDVEAINGKVGGLAVNIGARVAGLAESRELLVSSTVKDLTAGSGLVFEDAGVHELKGIPEPWRLYRVLDAAS